MSERHLAAAGRGGRTVRSKATRTNLAGDLLGGLLASCGVAVDERQRPEAGRKVAEGRRAAGGDLHAGNLSRLAQLVHVRADLDGQVEMRLRASSRHGMVRRRGAGGQRFAAMGQSGRLRLRLRLRCGMPLGGAAALGRAARTCVYILRGNASRTSSLLPASAALAPNMRLPISHERKPPST